MGSSFAGPGEILSCDQEIAESTLGDGGGDARGDGGGLHVSCLSVKRGGGDCGSSLDGDFGGEGCL